MSVSACRLRISRFRPVIALSVDYAHLLAKHFTLTSNTEEKYSQVKDDAAKYTSPRQSSFAVTENC